jgi:hypothetical protein
VIVRPLVRDLVRPLVRAVDDARVAGGDGPIITATQAPVLGPLAAGDAVSDAFTAGVYASTAGTIASQDVTVMVNGSPEGDGLAYVVAEGDVVQVQELVTDSEANTRTFSTAQQAVPWIAPALTGNLTPQTVTENTGVQTYDASVGFSGTALVYSLVSPPAGVTINASTGVVSIDTDATGLLDAEAVTVRATNPGGSAEDSFALTVSDAVPAWSPAELFAASEVGGWYDPSDLSTMFTDTAGTTPAAVGDAVARINDKSGNARHITIDTPSRRPALRLAGGFYYLEFDTIDDRIAAPVAIAANRSTLAIAYDDTPNSMALFHRQTTSTGWFYSPVSGSASTVHAETGFTVHNQWVSGASKTLTTRDQLWTDMQGGRTFIGDVQGAGITMNEVSIGQYFNLAVYAPRRIYGYIVRIGTITTGQVADLDAHWKTKTPT